jgi:hypothetical protein
MGGSRYRQGSAARLLTSPADQMVLSGGTRASTALNQASDRNVANARDQDVLHEVAKISVLDGSAGLCHKCSSVSAVLLEF